MPRNRKALLLAAALLITLGSCGDPEISGPGTCFTVGYLDITASAPLFIAQHEGLFESHSVCISTELFSSSNQLVDAIAAGRIDYVPEVSAVPALALQHRDPGRYFITAASTISENQPFDAILVREDSEVASLHDLRDKAIAVFPGTTATAMLRDFLDERGIDTASIRFLPTAPPNMLAALKSGAVDAVHAYEPTWAIGLSDPEIRELHGTVYGRQLSPNPQGIALLSREAYEDRPLKARALVAAFDESLELMSGDDPRVRDALRAHFDLPGDAVKSMHLLYMSPHNEISWRSLEQYAELLVRLGELDGQPNLSDLRLPDTE